jgi:hypothetical protein
MSRRPAWTGGRDGRRAGLRAAAVAVLAVSVAACSSSARTGTAAPTTSTATQTVPTSAPIVNGQAPTVFDCGGGAYEPATLLVVCGIATTMVTGVKWTSWTSTAASGSGSVHLTGHAQPAPADLALSAVVSTPHGPQFSVLTVTWTGPSPDGKPSDVFDLAVAR